MSWILTVVLVLILVTIRLLLPPVPNFIKTYSRKWGGRKTAILCGMSIAAAMLMILISRR